MDSKQGAKVLPQFQNQVAVLRFEWFFAEIADLATL